MKEVWVVVASVPWEADEYVGSFTSEEEADLIKAKYEGFFTDKRKVCPAHWLSVEKRVVFDSPGEFDEWFQKEYGGDLEALMQAKSKKAAEERRDE